MALAVFWLLPLGIRAGGYAVLSKELRPGQCEGIGFGCTLSSADGFRLVMDVIVIPAAFVVGLLACVAIGITQLWLQRRR